ncbi:excalibur calcium-binding domain-containing protein [Lysinibacillus sphaericus]|uniref:excalibur calcium-binding domain-containing protein n=1 Tax=Lysinibacillus sphaericus TaxID=1421 RepID=UPI0038058BC9
MHSRFWTIFFLIIFFPVGLFLMWKHSHFTKGTRVIITLFFLLIMFISSCGTNRAKEDELLKKEQELNDKEKDLLKLEIELDLLEKEIDEKIAEYEKIKEENKKLEEENERKKLEEIKKQEEQKKLEETQKQDTTQQPTTTTTAPQQSLNFSSCKEAKAAGYSNIRTGEPGYSSRLDRDGDGIACDK